MTAPKPTAEQIEAAQQYHESGRTGWDELASWLADREAAAEQRGREAGIREALRAVQEVGPLTDAERAIARLLTAPPRAATLSLPAEPVALECTNCAGSGGAHTWICPKCNGTGFITPAAPLTEACQRCGKSQRECDCEDPRVVGYENGPAAPLTGPELAQRHGFQPLAESGAARVAGVSAAPPAGECTCGNPYPDDEHDEHCPLFGSAAGECTCHPERAGGWKDPSCVLHGRAAGKR